MEVIKEVVSSIVSIIAAIMQAFVDVHDALNEFLSMLKEFNQKIVAMSLNPNADVGLPVVEAIGTFRYLVGDVAFYVIYMCVLFGCLFTIYKLVCLLVEAWHALKEQASAGSYSASAIGSIITKFFR